MKNVLLVFLGFVVGTVSVFLFITHGVEKQLGKNEPVKVETKTEVKYILGEKKECEEKGGKFKISGNLTYVLDKESIGNVYPEYSLTCTKYYEEGNKKIIETIFDYKI